MKVKKIISVTIFALMILAGICLMLYPLVSDWINQFSQSKVISDYQLKSDKLSDDEKAKQITEAKQYNKDLIVSVVLKDPFDAEALRDINEEYYNILSLDNTSVMGYLNIPKINVNLPIYHGTSEEVIKKGVGHLENTSFPVGGLGTHAVLSSHTGLSTARLFTDLNKLDSGDVFYIDVMEETLKYEVDLIKVVEPSNIKDLLIDVNHDYVTLVTCTPYGVNSHRLLVRGERVEEISDDNIVDDDLPDMDEQSSEEKHFGNNKLLFLIFSALIVIILVVIVFLIVRKQIKKNKDKKRSLK